MEKDVTIYSHKSVINSSRHDDTVPCTLLISIDHIRIYANKNLIWGILWRAAVVSSNCYFAGLSWIEVNGELATIP